MPWVLRNWWRLSRQVPGILAGGEEEGADAEVRLAVLVDGRRYWLSDDEISRLIGENERFQRIDSLGEMIAETFREPTAGEQGSWWANSQILDRLRSRFGRTTLKTVTPEKIGNAMSRTGFPFQSKHTNAGTKYLLVER